MVEFTCSNWCRQSGDDCGTWLSSCSCEVSLSPNWGSLILLMISDMFPRSSYFAKRTDFKKKSQLLNFSCFGSYVAVGLDGLFLFLFVSRAACFVISLRPSSLAWCAETTLGAVCVTSGASGCPLATGRRPEPLRPISCRQTDLFAGALTLMGGEVRGW